MALKLTEEEAMRLKSHTALSNHRRNGYNTHQKVTPLRALTIRNLYKSGVSKNQICKTMRCSRDTIKKALRGEYE